MMLRAEDCARPSQRLKRHVRAGQDLRPSVVTTPGPRVAIPERREEMDRGGIRAAVRDRDPDLDVLGTRLGVLDLDVEIATLVEGACVDELVLVVLLAPPTV